MHDIFCCFKGKKKDKIEEEHHLEGELVLTVNGRKNKPLII
jgi:hypothetical protein